MGVTINYRQSQSDFLLMNLNARAAHKLSALDSSIQMNIEHYGIEASTE